MGKMTITYPVRLPPDLYARIKTAARQDGRTAAGYMRRVLTLALAGDRQPKGGEQEHSK